MEDLSLEDEAQGTGYKAPAAKGLTEIYAQDTEDEALQRYKEALLGDKDDIAYDKNDERRVIVTKIELCSPELTENKVIVMSQDKDTVPLVIKEGAKFHIEVTYHVQHEIVSGLKYHQVVKRAGITLQKDDMMMGSYAPRKDHYIYKTEEEEAVSGMMKRGEYAVKSSFIDDDKMTHVAWNWKFQITKAW